MLLKKFTVILQKDSKNVFQNVFQLWFKNKSDLLDFINCCHYFFTFVWYFFQGDDKKKKKKKESADTATEPDAPPTTPASSRPASKKPAPSKKAKKGGGSNVFDQFTEKQVPDYIWFDCDQNFYQSNFRVNQFRLSF